MRYGKVDHNQAAIVEALRKAGISVQSMASLGRGVPDLLCADDKQVWLVEVKGPKGKLRPEQIEWIAAWRGAVHVIRTPEEALQLVGVL